jgi:hypothetical protein
MEKTKEDGGNEAAFVLLPKDLSSTRSNLGHVLALANQFETQTPEGRDMACCFRFVPTVS